MRVLIADDDALARRMLGSQLERLGHQVVAVEDGRGAVNALEAADAPRMAILDWNMPELDGTDVCRWLRQRAAPRYTYLALLTARNRPEDLVAGLEAGADDFLIKPVEIAELRARLQAADRFLTLESDLLRSRAYLEAVLENMDSGVVLLDRDRRIVLTNRAFESVWQVPRSDAIGLDRQQFLSRSANLFDDFDRARKRLTPDEASPVVAHDDVEIQRPTRRILRWSSKRVPLPEGDGRLDIFRDVTRESEQAETLIRQAERDLLTGLLNRRGGAAAMVHEFARRLRDKRPLAVMLIDIDHFKGVNDVFGHDVGDRVIQEVAHAVSTTLRPYDLAIRWGGEELLVVVPDASASAAATIAERIRKVVGSTRVAALPNVTVSVGVDQVGDNEPDLAPAVRRADVKLYEAKEAGRNCIR